MRVSSERPGSAPLWSGRFSSDPSAILWNYTVEHADRRLLADDVEGSMAHVTMLGEVGLVDDGELAELKDGLETILAESIAGDFSWEDTDEDVHSAVERRLYELIGEAAGKLHTGRSRNDQVALDLCLYLRRSATKRAGELRALAAMLADRADDLADLVVVTYTHLQQAQPVSFGHHLMAYAWMVMRDAARFDDLHRRANVSPLGAGASAGSSLPLRPEATAEHLGFEAVFDNSMDAVGSRDVAAEFAFVSAQAMIHLSRLSEDLILWSSTEFGWVTFSDELTTGSSALPQKKNPDIAELVRGRSAAVAGDVATLLALQKGLPLTYNRDLQEDKRAVFHADDVLEGSIVALGALVATADFHPPPPGPWIGALDLAEILVERGIPFRRAHEAVGALVARLDAADRTLADVTSDELVAAHPQFVADDIDAVDPRQSIAGRQTPGGGSPDSVRAQVGKLREML